MNWFFITVGTILVLLLTAAAVGPVFVDWTAYRGAIEANAQRVTGMDVAVRGEADLRLLPSPRIRLTDVVIGEPGAPFLEAGAVELDVDLAPLLRGEVRVLDLRLDEASVTVRIDGDGRLEMPAMRREPPLAGFLEADGVSVDSVAVDGLRLVVADARTGARHTVEDVTMTGSARSLRGPFNASGTARIGGAVHGLRIAGGAVEDDGAMALSVRLAPPRESVSVGFDGRVDLSAAAPRLVGRLALEGGGEGDMPWSITTDMAADTGIVTLDNASIAFGPPEAPVEFEGSAYYAFAGDEPLSIALQARQIDLDRIHRVLSGEEAAAQDPAALLSAAPVPPGAKAALLAAHAGPLVRHVTDAVGADAAASVTLDVGTVLSGGALVRDVSLAASARFGRLEIDRAEALLPGDTLVEASGRLREEGFAGWIGARAAQPALLARWWTGGEAAGLVLDPILLDADVDIAPGRVDARRLSLRIGDSAARGRALWRAGAGDEAAIIDVALSAPVVDAEDLVAGASFLRLAGVSPAGLADILIDVSVDRLRLAAVEAASLDVDATYRDDTLTVDAFSVDDLAGARVFASGVIGGLTATPVGTIDGSLEIVDGRPLAESLRALLPGNVVAARVADALPELAPGNLNLSLAGRPVGATRDLSLRATGTLAGTDVSLTATGSPFDEGWRERSASLRVEATNANAARLARQLGLPADPDAGLPPATLTVDLDGTPASGMTAETRVSTGGDVFGFTGEIEAGTGLSLNGLLSAEVARLEDLAPLVGRALPAAGAVSLAADAESEADGTLALTGLRGTLGGVDVAGKLTLAADGASGALSIGETDARALATLALGPDAWSATGGAERVWPDAEFGAPFLPGLPVDLAVSADRLTAGRWNLDDARFTLSADEQRLVVSDLSAGLAGGTISGDVTLARAGSRVDLGAVIALEDAVLEDLVRREEGRPVVSGRLTLSADVVSSGFSVAGLVAGLSGTGAIAVEEGTLQHMNPAPFDGLARMLDADEPPGEEAVAAAFVRHLDRAALPFRRIAASLDIAAGAVRMEGDTTVSGAPLAIDTAILDLDRWRAEGDLTLPVPVPQDAVAPQEDPAEDGRVEARIAFAGPLGDPARSVNVSGLTAWASLRHLERQVEAVERQNEELAAEAAAIDPALPEADDGPASLPEAGEDPGVSSGEPGADASGPAQPATRPEGADDADPSTPAGAPPGRNAGPAAADADASAESGAGAALQPEPPPASADGAAATPPVAAGDVPVPQPPPAGGARRAAPGDAAPPSPARNAGPDAAAVDPVVLGSTAAPGGPARDRSGAADPIGAFLRSTLPDSRSLDPQGADPAGTSGRGDEDDGSADADAGARAPFTGEPQIAPAPLRIDREDATRDPP